MDSKHGSLTVVSTILKLDNPINNEAKIALDLLLEHAQHVLMAIVPITPEQFVNG